MNMINLFLSDKGFEDKNQLLRFSQPIRELHSNSYLVSRMKISVRIEKSKKLIIIPQNIFWKTMKA